ncbi:MAG TPA: hypothetical protein VG650_03380 [Mycobacteriales bacterium]|nr:hypothetical protein [Mycobacteriales bacterium]
MGAAFVTSPVSASAATSSFTDPGCSTWDVPAGVTMVHISATGAAGVSTSQSSGGRGDGVSGTLTGLTSGEALQVCVDYGGGNGTGEASTSPAGAPGGASTVAIGGEFPTPVLVAGGGGGAGSSGTGSGDSSPGGNGGDAGYPAGSPGGSAPGGAAGGGGGTDRSGGVGGVNGSGGTGAFAGSPGTGFFQTPGLGGAGGADYYTGAPVLTFGGGGGAGYYGGGGGAGGNPGAGGGGGGGGSDYCAPSVTGCAVTAGAGTQTKAGSAPGDAEVVITMPDPTLLIASPAVVQTSPAAAPLFKLSATLTDRLTRAAVPHESVAFTAGKTTLCSVLTNAAGVATCTANSKAGSAAAVVENDGYTVHFRGDASYLPSSGSAGLAG